jgi:hypothetical protein
MTSRRIETKITATLRRGPSAYSVTVGLFVAGAVLASVIGPPTAYLVPIVVAAWAVLYWTIKRESGPRYRREQ